MVFETKDHRKTIDINGGFPTVHGEDNPRQCGKAIVTNASGAIW